MLNWLLGFGFFVFMWFLLSMIIVPGRTQLLTSIGFLALLALPSYLRNRECVSLFKELWKLKVPILIIAPFLPAVFVKASLPPYYSDELAYHFVSPLQINSLVPVHYVNDLYANFPRTLDFFWQLVFALFRTYSIARLFHFTILATSMLYAYAVIKKNYGLLYAFLFIFVFFSIPQDVILYSTLGYNDIGAMAFLLIGLISGIDFILNRNENSVLYLFIFWGMSLGTKYTGVSSFAVFLSAFFVLAMKLKKKYVEIFKPALIIKFTVAFVVFGGYWYVKNLIAFGNPIYPFIFNCWGTAVNHCPIEDIFGGWTTKVGLKTLYPILTELFPKYVFIRILAVMAPVVVLFGKDRKTKWIVITLFTTVVAELVILKFSSGFYLRYHQHMELYLLLGGVLLLSDRYKNRLVKIAVKLSLLGLITTSIFMYIYTIHYTNSHTLGWDEINYSVGNINIYDWIDSSYPHMKYISRWCDKPPEKGVVQLAKFEPDYVWHMPKNLDDYYMRAFATNCSLYRPLRDVPAEDALNYAKDNKMKFWLASINGCVSDVEAHSPYPGEKENFIPLRTLNNIFVCNSTEVGLHLYYFDYSKLE